MTFPAVAAVDRAVAGGGTGLAPTADVRVAAADAKGGDERVPQRGTTDGDIWRVGQPQGVIDPVGTRAELATAIMAEAEDFAGRTLPGLAKEFVRG
ncbi:hypothetical protein ABTZ59_32505 [Streptomyces sp. NPDC094034]|uniref:hypothetical protein n=1 Tax=Streptomyces sp. NPDC094034 TaxID=3155309 RepID=UPI003334450C